jgi:DNA invertase Pin-like site-specific DNA recombinase
MLTVKVGVAEFERDLIRTRAVANGVKLGRKPTLTPHQKAEARKRDAKGEPTRDLAKSYGVSVSTISRLVC